MDDLKQLAELKGHKDVIRSLTWQPKSGDKLVSVETGYLRTWDAGEGSAQVIIVIIMIIKRVVTITRFQSED